MNVIALLCGALFAAGACVSGRVRPSKVLGFLDLGGSWDATLMLVMIAGLAVHVLAWRVVRRATAPRFGARYPGPPARTIDRRLVAGAAIFGIGWGLAGYCPGPAVISLVSGARSSFVFVGAMLAGILLARAVAARDDS